MAIPPPLIIPSGAVAAVSIIDTTSSIAQLKLEHLMGPPVPSIPYLPTFPSFSFLISNAQSKRVLFDLGIRKDWQNYSTLIQERLKRRGWVVGAEKNVDEILAENGVDKGSVGGIVWSHWHWDHLGDPSKFPSSTDLIVGPGFKEAFMPGAPKDMESPILETDYEGRNLREIDFGGPDTLKIGKMRAYDYFRDGSFYLLDTPGHAIGHLCALARTTANPDTFIFMGGDAAHHGGEFRPSEYHPIPDSITPHPMKGAHANSEPFCPGHFFEDLNKKRGRYPNGPLFDPTVGHDIPLAIRTIRDVQEADANDNVFVIIAHDDTVKGVVDLFPKSANDWKEKGWAKDVRWAFLKEFEPAIKEKA